MENEKWGFELNTGDEHMAAKRYLPIIRFILFFIVLILLKPIFIMSKKNDCHVYLVDVVKLCFITALLSLCSEFTPDALKKFNDWF